MKDFFSRNGYNFFIFPGVAASESFLRTQWCFVVIEMSLKVAGGFVFLRDTAPVSRHSRIPGVVSGLQYRPHKDESLFFKLKAGSFTCW